MANRHLSRSIVLQTLFEWDFAVEGNTNTEEMIKRNIEEFGPGLDDDQFITDLFNGVVKKKQIIDEIIEKAAPDWPIEKISIVDRNVLRIGLYELVFGNKEQVPPKVAINEAIELAKTFGGENSSRFVNGVLGGVYKEMGEPGKDDVHPKKKNFETDPAKFPIEKKAGAVVYAHHEGELYFAFVHDVFGYWTLSKGSIEEGENEEEGATREIKEEMGLDIKIKELLGRNEYIACHPEKGKIRKQVAFFLAESDYREIVLEKGTGGLDDARWFKIDEVPNLRMYDNMIPLLTKTIDILSKDNN
ncbi:MAG: transcription antitermination factor NusB [Candidatus Moranbacteria bacterium]|nr:transcription antitermination factor NusB [Candidatus Moranbacteria bacterium]